MDMEIKNIIIDPNFLIDILIKFILLSSYVYLLYKYFLIDITVNYVIDAFQHHINIYLNKIQDLKSKNKDFLNIIINNILSTINSTKSTPINKTSNDNNMMTIYFSMCSSVIVIVLSIIYISNTQSYINYKNMFYSLIVNIIFITISQVFFFYLIYSYIDPIKFYNLLYHDYTITKSSPIINSGTTNTTPSQLQQLQQLFMTPDSSFNTSSVNYQIINSQTATAIFIFIIIFICLTILFAIISYLNYLVVYKYYTNLNIILPLNKISLPIYIILSIIFLIGFIVLVLLLKYII